MNWIFYNTGTYPNAQLRGAICAVFSGTESEAAANLSSHQAAMPYADTVEGRYVDLISSSVVNKTSLALAVSKTTINADGTDETIISGLPVPCEVEVNGIMITVADGLLEFQAEEAGQYNILVNTAAHFDEMVTIYAV